MARIQELDHLQIPLEDIKLATNNFSEDNFIGLGGFGKVYEGQLHVSDFATTSSISGRPVTTVAVKRLDVQGGQGKNEFLNEIVMLASYKHKNLASIVGFCDEGGEKIIIYKYEARGSLDNYLANDHLTWVQRLQICLGAARGLNYLHADVGESHSPTNQNITFLVTNAAGTLGYVDPLYVSTGVLTKESDVYSFGVVLFEVLCGRLAMKNMYEDERRFLFHLAKLRYEKGKLDEIILPSIREQMKPNSLQTFCKIAYQCLKKKRHDRPKMLLVIEQLQISLDFQIGYLRMTELCGSNTGGYSWSLLLDINHKLRKITIDHYDCIFSVRFTTEDLSGSLHSTQRYGGDNGLSPGKITEVHFDADEEITGIRIGVTSEIGGLVLIASIYIMTNKNGHGPFGKEPVSFFSEFWDAGSFAGFYGRAGHFLDGFGCYLKATM
ncbi:hypothetical protein Lser_V15G08839 [Lactuca serriola]